VHPWKQAILAAGLGVLLILTIIGAAVASRPRAIHATLPDGSFVRVEKITDGKQHELMHTEFQAPIPFPVRMKIIRPTANNALCLFLSHRLPDRRTCTNMNWCKMATAADAHGCPFRASVTPAFGTQKFQASCAVFESFPRTSDHIVVKLLDLSGKEVCSLNVPIPENARTDIRQAHPAPLPQTNQAADLTCVLKSVKVRTRTNMVNGLSIALPEIAPELDLLEKGKPSADWFNNSTQIADTTGNQFVSSALWNGICLHAPAWNIHFDLRRHESADFPAEQTWSLPVFKLPASNSVQVVDLTRKVPPGLIRLWALVGPGSNAYQIPPARRGSTSGTGYSSSGSVGGDAFSFHSSFANGANTVTSTTTFPYLALDAIDVPAAIRLSLRVHDDRGRKVKVLDTMAHFASFKVWGLLPERDAKTLSINFLIDPGRSTTFTVSPPSINIAPAVLPGSPSPTPNNRPTPL